MSLSVRDVLPRRQAMRLRAGQAGDHRNTLNHRMRQVQALTGLDLNDVRQRLNLAIALMIRRLSSHTSNSRKSP